MKKHTFYYLLGALTILLLSFNTAVLHTIVQPKAPSSTVVCHTKDCWKQWVHKGYQLKSVGVGANDWGGYYSYILLKY